MAYVFGFLYSGSITAYHSGKITSYICFITVYHTFTYSIAYWYGNWMSYMESKEYGE